MYVQSPSKSDQSSPKRDHSPLVVDVVDDKEVDEGFDNSVEMSPHPHLSWPSWDYLSLLLLYVSHTKSANKCKHAAEIMGPIVPPRSIKPCRRADQQQASERKCGRVSNEQSIPHTTESHLIAMPWKMENGTFAPGSRIFAAGIPNYLIFPEPVARNHVATFKSLTNFRYPVFSSLILQNSRDFSNIPKMEPFSPASDWRPKHNGFMVEQFTPILWSIPFVATWAGRWVADLFSANLLPYSGQAENPPTCWQKMKTLPLCILKVNDHLKVSMTDKPKIRAGDLPIYIWTYFQWHSI